VIVLPPEGHGPLFLRIAHAIAEDVTRGRLRPGARLPGTRQLAATLSVHRNTVVAAYAELATEGWVQTQRGGGTFVSSEIPDRERRSFARRSGMRDRAGFDLAPERVELPSEMLTPATLALWGGVPDLRLVPHATIARAYGRVMRRAGSRLLAYTHPGGHPELRAQIVSWVANASGIVAGPDSVMVTRGSQMGLDLLARTLISRGDAVVVEALGYRPAWGALERAGARLIPLDVDAEGLDTKALGKLCQRRKIRAIYVTPHHHYPTTVVMAPSRRLQLLELAARHRICVIEDDYDHEFHYEGRPILPLASSDTAGVVVYVGSLSKILAPGLRLGFAVAPPDLVKRMAAERFLIDRQGDTVLELAIAELMEDGELRQHVRRMRGVYQKRRDALVESLQRRLGSVLSFDVPRGGMALWAHAPGVDVGAWKRRSREKGVAFFVGRDFAFDDKARPYLRLGFAGLDEKEIDEAVRRMSLAMVEEG
jgi:GntR family transcriptional regulator / MocR family aminotransferase